jgi:DNA-binding response OmpR family regulator
MAAMVARSCNATVTVLVIVASCGRSYDLTMTEPFTARPILVVDDDAMIVRLVRTYLEREGYRVVTAADGPAALDAIARHQPCLAVLDLMLPEMDGLAVIRALRSQNVATPILMLSARGALADRIRGLEDGADDYMPKPFSPAELVLRVKSILRRSASAAGSSEEAASGGVEMPPIMHGDLVVDLARYEVLRSGERIDLTRVEFQLLSALLQAKGRVLSRDQLLDALYGHDATEIMDRTIDVHIGRLREKLTDNPDRPRYIATVRGVGYRAAPAPEPTPSVPTPTATA